MEKASDVICKTCINRGKDIKAIGADDFLPILSWVLIHSNVNELLYDIHFLLDFISDDEQLGKKGYLLISIHSAITLALNLEYNNQDDQNIDTDVKDDELSNIDRSMEFDSNISTRRLLKSNTKSIISTKRRNVLNSSLTLIKNERILTEQDHFDLIKRLFYYLVELFTRHFLPVVEVKTLSGVRSLMQADSSYKKFMDEVCLLQTATPEVLEEKKKLSFFINLYHILLLHIFITKDVPTGSLARLKTLKQFGYQIGDVLLTAADIEYGILRRKLVTPNFLGFSFPTKLSSSKNKYLLQETYPTICFALSTFTKSGARLRFYTDNVVQEIEEATKFYLQRSIILENNVSLPRLLDWYKYDFGVTIGDALITLSNFLDSETQSKLKDNLITTSIKWRSHDWDFAFKWNNVELKIDLNEREEDVTENESSNFQIGKSRNRDIIL